mgnify:CR=1 FL=1
MSELKNAQKKLNSQMKKEMNNGNKNGQSARLMKLAKKQEEIRRNLLDLLNKEGDSKLNNNIIQEMEENEIDIINNNITIKTIRRQEEILTKLLEADDAIREKEKDNKRESTEWSFTLEEETKKYLEYKKTKKAYEEIIKTTPLKLKPFYKKKVTNYFKSLNQDKL